MTPPIELIALDLDGTLLDSQHRLRDRTVQTLHAAMAQGVHVVLATGKTPASDEPALSRLGLTLPGVYLQGLLVGDRQGTVLYERTLPPEAAQQTIAFAHDRGLTLVGYQRANILCEASNEYTDQLLHYNEPAPQPVGPFSQLPPETTFNKLIFIAEPEQIPAIRTELEPLLGSSASMVQAIPTMLEVLPPGASKGDGLRRLLAMLHIPAAHVLAVGDAENDLEMIQLAGVGVAMGNALPNLKSVADYVTLSNDEDGVAEAIIRFVLHAQPAT